MNKNQIGDISQIYKFLYYEANIRSKTEKLFLGKDREPVEQNIFDLLMTVVNYDYSFARAKIEEAINAPLPDPAYNGVNIFAKYGDNLDFDEYASFLINIALSEETPLFIQCLLHQVISDYKNAFKPKNRYDMQALFIHYVTSSVLSLFCFRDYMDLIAYNTKHKYKHEYRSLPKYQLFIRHICQIDYDAMYPKSSYSNKWAEASSDIERLHAYEDQTSEDLVEFPSYIPGKSCLSLICACFEQLIIHDGFIVMKCKNCGKYFIASDLHSRYCSNPSPNNEEKTCRELQSYLSYIKHKGSVSHDVKLIRDRKRIAVSRNPENKEYKDDFDKFASIQKRLRSMYRKGEISEEVYSKWINDAKTLKFTPDFDFDKLSNENS